MDPRCTLIRKCFFPQCQTASTRVDTVTPWIDHLSRPKPRSGPYQGGEPLTGTQQNASWRRVRATRTGKTKPRRVIGAQGVDGNSVAHDVAGLPELRWHQAPVVGRGLILHELKGLGRRFAGATRSPWGVLGQARAASARPACRRHRLLLLLLPRLCLPIEQIFYGKEPAARAQIIAGILSPVPIEIEAAG